VVVLLSSVNNPFPGFASKVSARFDNLTRPLHPFRSVVRLYDAHWHDNGSIVMQVSHLQGQGDSSTRTAAEDSRRKPNPSLSISYNEILPLLQKGA